MLGLGIPTGNSENQNLTIYLQKKNFKSGLKSWKITDWIDAGFALKKNRV